jgi:Ran GTPase-activating protein (RanGAP) involved in mRNA processing and transport
MSADVSTPPQTRCSICNEFYYTDKSILDELPIDIARSIIPYMGNDIHSDNSNFDAFSQLSQTSHHLMCHDHIVKRYFCSKDTCNSTIYGIKDLLEYIDSNKDRDHDPDVHRFIIDRDYEFQLELENADYVRFFEIMNQNTTIHTMILKDILRNDDHYRALSSILRTNTTIQTLNIQLNNSQFLEYLVNGLRANSSTALSNLDVKIDQFPENGMESFADMLKTNRSIRDISLRLNTPGTVLSANDMRFFVDALCNNPRIVRLNLVMDFDANSLRYMSEHFDKMNIEDLCLCHLQSDIEKTKMVANIIRRSSKLRILHLTSSNYNADNIQYITDALRFNTTVHTLNLIMNDIGVTSSNLIMDRGIQSIADMLHDNTTLMTLNLSNNFIYGETITPLWLALRKNTTLRTLSLCDNDMRKMSMKLFCDTFTINHTLRNLYLSNCKIPVKNMKFFINVAETNTSIHMINLEGNGISRKILTEFYQMISH